MVIQSYRLHAMAAKRPNRQKLPRQIMKPRRRFRWASKDGRSGLPKYDCQSPVQTHRKIKGLDCEAHASILRQRLQDLLGTQNNDNLHDAAANPPNDGHSQQENSTEVNYRPLPLAYSRVPQYDTALNECLREVELNPRNSKVLFRLAGIYTRLRRSRDALNTYARIQQGRGPSASGSWLERPKSIPMEVPHINPNFTAALAVLSRSSSAEMQQNDIPLFDPSLLRNISTQRPTTRVSTNMSFATYTPIINLRLQPLARALLR